MAITKSVEINMGRNHYSYDKDFYAWTMHNAELIRQGRFSEIDVEHVAEEIESMGRSDKRELISRLAVLVAHLLKWQLQPARHSNSWKYTIKEQRLEIADLLKESPSLNHELNSRLDHAYKRAIVIAAKEIGLDEKKFPKSCPFTLEQCLKYTFLPK